MNLRSKCNHYEGCESPFCPMLSEEENRKRVWYPHEKICRRRKDLPEWVRQQKKIAAKARRENHGFYFTLDMLMVPFRVSEGVTGLGSDEGDKEKKLRSWFKRNKGTGREKISDRQRKHRRGKNRAQRILDQILSPGEACACSSENESRIDQPLSTNQEETLAMASEALKNETKNELLTAEMGAANHG